MRRCRYRRCGREFEPAKPNHFFCCWQHCQAHYQENDYRGYQRERNQQYDGGFADGLRAQPPAAVMPRGIWSMAMQLCHPDRWHGAPTVTRTMAHEVCVWLNAHRPGER
jgi:hypothetical protein